MSIAGSGVAAGPGSGAGPGSSTGPGSFAGGAGGSLTGAEPGSGAGGSLAGGAGGSLAGGAGGFGAAFGSGMLGASGASSSPPPPPGPRLLAQLAQVPATRPATAIETDARRTLRANSVIDTLSQVCFRPCRWADGNRRAAPENL